MDNDVIENVAVAGAAVISVKEFIKYFLFLLLGLFSFLVSFLSFIHDRTYIETTAVVVDIREDDSLDFYYPILEYSVNGKKIRGEGFPVSDKNEITIGSEKIINYNPEKPKVFDEGSKKDGTLLFILSIVTLSFSIYGLVEIIKLFKVYVLKKNTFNSLTNN